MCNVAGIFVQDHMPINVKFMYISAPGHNVLTVVSSYACRHALCLFTYIHSFMSVYIYTWKHAWLYLGMSGYTHTYYMHIHSWMSAYIPMYVHVYNIYVYIH